MRRELLRAGIGVGVFFLLLAVVVLFATRAQTPTEEQNEASAAVVVEGSGEAGAEEAFLGERLVPAQSAPDFDLTDRSGARVKLEDFEGKVILLSFGYTGCPDVCPALFARFLEVQQEFAADLGKDLVLAFISVDPEADTPERLDEHVRAVGGEWYFLTGRLPVMQEVWKAYRVRVEKEGVLVAHTAVTYLIDRNGLIQVRYPGVPPARVFIADIERMLE